MKERGTFLVPTFITLEDLTQPGGDYTGPVLELRGKFIMPQAEKVFKKALALGVKIATGADNSYTATTLPWFVSPRTNIFNQTNMLN
ncbi:MAG: hypothetical protein IM618_17435 [Cytophagales bacterium]|nr:hypothetical protein [Cytophagales bacterium]MCA6378004.1 hypothetical protein [Cytophagales bacterium]MCA6385705.1 hypothetical protein [Cytophagales bacterium]